MTESAIPLADAPRLRRQARRTRVVRIVLAAALVATLLTGIVLARAPRVAAVQPLPVGSRGIVVLDLSASVETGKLKRIYTALTQLAETPSGRFGLVIFAGWAYEALPPSTPARELAAFARFFHPTNPPRGVTGYSRARPYFLRNPWAQGFAAGTQISTGLNLAHDIILAGGRGGRSVVLISDLADFASDVPLAASAARSFRDDGIAFHVVGIGAALANAQFWQRLAGPGGSYTAARLPVEQRLAQTSSFPLGLAIAAVIVAVLLAVNELLSAPLRWGAPRAVEEAAA